METLTIGKALRAIRGTLDLTLKDVARRASISPAALSLIETGQRHPGMKVLDQIAGALNVPLEVLYHIEVKSIWLVDKRARTIMAHLLIYMRRVQQLRRIIASQRAEAA